MHRKRASVLATPGDLPADADDFGAAGPAIIAEVSIVLAMKRLGHQQVDVFPRQFFCRISEKFFRRGVGGSHHTALVDCDYRVRGGIENSAHELSGAAQFLLGLQPRAHIARDLAGADYLSLAIAYRRYRNR